VLDSLRPRRARARSSGMPDPKTRVTMPPLAMIRRFLVVAQVAEELEMFGGELHVASDPVCRAST